MKEESFGIIPLRQVGNQRQLLLVQHQAGHWAFPKGHPEEGETAQETALRELKEETNLEVTSFLQAEPLHESYSLLRQGKRVEKKVTYFLAFVEGNLQLAEGEIVAARWLLPQEAKTVATFAECISLIDQAVNSANLSL